jgi:hypothetical protein
MSLAKFIWGLSGKTYTDPAEYEAAALLGPAVTIVALPVNGTPFNPPKRIIADKPGTATVTDASGNTLAGFPLTGGEQAIAITAINNLATSTQIWGLY